MNGYPFKTTAPVGALLVSVLAAVVLSGCGGLSAAQVAQNRQTNARLLASTVKPREQTLTRQARHKAQEACEAQIGDFITELSDLDSRLDVGLGFSDYSTHVGDIHAAYDRISMSALSSDCLKAARTGERAMNAYVAAYRTWNSCFGDWYCSMDSIDPELQIHWANATDNVGTSKAQEETVGRLAGPDSDWSNAVPLTASAVPHSVYGRAASEVCTEPNLPAAATAPCTDLRTILQGGVTSSELQALDKAVKELNTALGVEPNTP